LAAFVAGVEELRSLTERFVLVNNQARVRELVDQRDRLHAMYVWLGALVVLQALVMGAIITLQLRQNSSLADANRRLEEAGRDLARAAEEAKAANRAKSEFLATISHEIRTPMNAVLGLIELMRATDLTTAQFAQLDKIRRAAMGLLHLINEVLDMASIEAGRLRIVAQPTQLRALVGEIVDLMEPTAQQKGLALAADIAPDLPERVDTDPGRLRQVLLNLVGNAVKFTETGGISIRVGIAEFDGATQMRLRVVVEDTGIGIPENARTMLFQSFTTIESGTARRHGGAGLGLSISKRLVDLLDGDIGYDSKPGQGSRFWFEIPVSRLPDLPGEPKGEGRVPSDKPAQGRPLKILVVEDNATNREIALGYLGLLGHSAEAVASGPEALDISAEQHFDVILMDVRMPGMDGLEVARRMRAMPDYRAQVPIIALTANVMQADKEACFAAGMTDFLAKPLDLNDLRNTVNAAAGQIEAGDGDTLAVSMPAAPAPTRTDEEPLSPRMAELCATLGAEGLSSIAQLFLSEIGQRQKALEDAASGPSWAGLREQAHALKGMALDMGLDELGAVAHTLETMAAGVLKGDPADTERLAVLRRDLDEKTVRGLDRLRRLIAF
jgi:signal transduction histidine kinase/DNA-binding NarL/FixJ family response regulator